jgi:heme A synthase
VHFAHRLGAVLVAAAVVHLAWRALRSGDARFRGLGLGLVVLAALQVALGGWTVLSGKAVMPTTLHVATGAAILGGCVLSTLRAGRLGRRDEDAAPARQALAVEPPGLKAWS